MLKFDHVSVAFDSQKPSLCDFTLQVQSGEIIALVGESGSGKTTAIRAALGLLPAGGEIIAGDIRFADKSLLDLSAHAWGNLRGREISMIFQDAGAMLNPIRTIGSQFVEHIRHHEPQTPKSEAKKRALDMLLAMGLGNGENIMRAYPFMLSGGMRQRVGIAMAMVFQPKLLLADEPTSALDVTTQAQIVRQMMELRDKYGTTIIIVTHNLGVAAYMADRIFVMQQGKLAESGTREQILHNPQQQYTKDLLHAVPAFKGEENV